jgi:hypothetical protein
MDRQPSKPRRRYQRVNRPIDRRLTDESATFAFQINGERARADHDMYWALRWACLRRAITDLEQAHDVRQGLRHHLEDPADYPGTVAEIEDFFFADEFSQYHAPDISPTEATTETETIDSAPAVSGLNISIEKADGVFSFVGLCQALSIEIDAARSVLRAWVNRRLQGSTERLIFDGHHRNVTPRPPRPQRARRPALTSDELLDDTAAARTAKIREVITRRCAGESPEAIAAALHMREPAVRAALRRNRDDLPPDLRPRHRAVREAKNARDAEVCRARALGVPRSQLSDRFGLAAPTISTILNEHALAIREVLDANGIALN